MIHIQEIYDILSKHYEMHSSLFLTREVKGNNKFFYNFNCPQSLRQMLEAMNAMYLFDEVSIKSIEARFYDKNKKMSAYHCNDYMVKVSEHKTENSYYISLSFYGITGVVVKKIYGNYEAKLSYDSKHILSIYVNAKNGNLYGKGVGNQESLYPMSFSAYVNKIMLHSEAFLDIFKEILMLCSDGQNIIKDIVRTMEEEGYMALPITIFDIKKYHTKDEMVRGFTETDLPVDFNKCSLNQGYLLTALAREIPPEQVGYMIQIDKNMIINIMRDIYKEVYPLDNFAREFIIRYYIQKLAMENTRDNQRLIADYIGLSIDQGLPVSINFKSVNRLIREHDRLAGQYRKEKLADKMSPPLIAENTKFAELRRILPEEFEWVTTTQRLFEEGESQQNCVFSYRNKIRNDVSTVYHWVKDGREYIIEFGRNLDGRYTIKQMLQKRNARAKDSDLEYVKECLGNRLGSSSDKPVENERPLWELPEDIDDMDDLPFI